MWVDHIYEKKIIDDYPILRNHIQILVVMLLNLDLDELL